MFLMMLQPTGNLCATRYGCFMQLLCQISQRGDGSPLVRVGSARQVRAAIGAQAALQHVTGYATYGGMIASRPVAGPDGRDCDAGSCGHAVDADERGQGRLRL
jgi:hypothetical protein